MGRLDHRLPARLFRRARSPVPPTKYYSIDAPLPGFWQDGIPLWEKKYCTTVGWVPWQKIVDSKEMEFLHIKVLNWNDSGAEEAFQNAKKCYWAKINSLPCAISLPNPDTYIDQIEWNPYIDPELIKELDSAFFTLPDGKQENVVNSKRTKTSVDGENPWECSGTPLCRDLENNEVQRWNQGGSGNADYADDPWECNIARRNGGLTDKAWEGVPVKSGSWNEGKDNNNQCKDWTSGYSKKDKGWDKVRDSSWCQQQSSNLANIGNSWHCKSSQHNLTPTNTGWRNSGTNVSGWRNSGTDVSGWRNSGTDMSEWGNSGTNMTGWRNSGTNVSGWRNNGTNVSGWKQQQNTDVSSDWQCRRNYGGWTAQNQGYQQRDGSNRHTLGYNGPGLQRDDRQTGHYWKRGKSKKRDFAP